MTYLGVVQKANSASKYTDYMTVIDGVQADVSTFISWRPGGNHPPFLCMALERRNSDGPPFIRSALTFLIQPGGLEEPTQPGSVEPHVVMETILGVPGVSDYVSTGYPLAGMCQYG